MAVQESGSGRAAELVLDPVVGKFGLVVVGNIDLLEGAIFNSSEGGLEGLVRIRYSLL